MQVAGMLASISKLCAQCDRIAGTSSMEPLNPCNDIVGNSCQAPAKCVWKTKEGFITRKEEQFQFPRKTKMYQLSFEAKTFWTALSCAFNRVYFQYLQCPCTVLFTSAPLFKFELFFLLLLWFLFQDNLHIVNRGSYTISMRICCVSILPHLQVKQWRQRTNGSDCSSTTEAKSRWTTSGSVGPKMASPKISPPGIGWGDPFGYWNDWEIWLMWNAHFFAHECPMFIIVYLDFLMLLCNSLGRLSVITTKWNCMSFVKSIGGAESFSFTGHGFPRSVPWCE